jgi:hypothetical protein
LIDRMLSAKGKVNAGIYQISLKRVGKVSDARMAVPDAMGSAEAIKFQPTGGQGCDRRGFRPDCQ